MMFKRKTLKVHPKDEKGFTLLEVMISVIILSIGLLGIAALQDAAIKGTINGSKMSIGTNLVDEMMERIRLRNPGATVSGFSISDYNGINTSDYNTDQDATNDSTRPPSTAWQARGDYDQWAARIYQYLPGGVGTVTVTQPATNPLGRDDVTVNITWPGATRNFTIRMTSSFL